MVFLVVDSSTGDLIYRRAATRRHLQITAEALARLLKQALAAGWQATALTSCQGGGCSIPGFGWCVVIAYP